MWYLVLKSKVEQTKTTTFPHCLLSKDMLLNKFFLGIKLQITEK